jgi:hypothetical protein
MKQGNSLSIEPEWIWIQTRRPRDEDPGAIEEGWYFAEGGKVFLCDAAGVKTGTSKALRPGDIAKEIAVRLLRDETGKRRWSDFNRPLRYPKNFY